MPRFRPQSSTSDDPTDKYAQYDTDDDSDRRSRRTRPIDRSGPRVAEIGRSGRRQVEVDEEAPDPRSVPSTGDISYSTYDVAAHGPEPAPDWLVTALSAVDTRLGALKSGKEADVALLERALPGGPGCLLAVKTYRDSAHRMFHRDAGYQEGRRTRRSRETRAMANRTRFGRELLSGQWAGAEFAALSRLWQEGAPVPYPVQLIGSELMMEFIGDPDGTAAPRLAAWDGDPADAGELYHDLVGTLSLLAELGLTHGDLSPYNVLVHEERCVLIDLPQVVDVIANPQGPTYLERDCRRITDFFARRGVQAADADLLTAHLAGLAMR